MSKNVKVGWKIGISAVFGVFCIIAMVAGIVPTKNTSTSDAEKADKALVENCKGIIKYDWGKPVCVEDKGAEMEKAMKMIQVGKESEAEKILKTQIGAMIKEDNGDVTFRKIDVVTQIDKTIGVFVEFNASDNFSKGMIKGGIEITMYRIYKLLYTSPDFGDVVGQATVAAYFSMMDKYGNESEDVVYKTGLEKKTADKINWKNIDLPQQLAELWDVYLISPELSQ
jgi:hypothetical protein